MTISIGDVTLYVPGIMGCGWVDNPSEAADKKEILLFVHMMGGKETVIRFPYAEGHHTGCLHFVEGQYQNLLRQVREYHEMDPFAVWPDHHVVLPFVRGVSSGLNREDLPNGEVELGFSVILHHEPLANPPSEQMGTWVKPSRYGLPCRVEKFTREMENIRHRLAAAMHATHQQMAKKAGAAPSLLPGLGLPGKRSNLLDVPFAVKR